MTPENSKGHYPPSDEYRKRAFVKSTEEYERIYSGSVKDPAAYWAKEAEQIDWFSKDWKETFTWNKKENRFTWFRGGELNVS
ncbi:MAG: hypothetical protein FWG19_04350, partial [Methanomassiliicoccaceae archaeon]|nr:hypothetical protein [Methanomassiliicoccaceae archaeon]